MMLIKNGQILTMDAQGTLFERGDILIKEGKIAALGPGGTLAIPDAGVDQVIDASNRLVMPGLINAHNHSKSALTKMAGSKR